MNKKKRIWASDKHTHTEIFDLWVAPNILIYSLPIMWRDVRFDRYIHVLVLVLWKEEVTYQ